MYVYLIKHTVWKESDSVDIFVTFIKPALFKGLSSAAINSYKISIFTSYFINIIPDEEYQV